MLWVGKEMWECGKEMWECFWKKERVDFGGRKGVYISMDEQPAVGHHKTILMELIALAEIFVVN